MFLHYLCTADAKERSEEEMSRVLSFWLFEAIGNYFCYSFGFSVGESSTVKHN